MASRTWRSAHTRTCANYLWLDQLVRLQLGKKMTFFTVRYSQAKPELDEEEDLFAVFNSDCFLYHLVQSMRQRCDCSETDNLVLVDEACKPILVTEMAMEKGLQNASPYFTERGNYILLTKDKKKGNSKPTYQCRLASKFIDEDFYERIQALSNPEIAKRRKQKISVQKWMDTTKASKDAKQPGKASAKKWLEAARAKKAAK